LITLIDKLINQHFILLSGKIFPVSVAIQ